MFDFALKIGENGCDRVARGLNALTSCQTSFIEHAKIKTFTTDCAYHVGSCNIHQLHIIRSIDHDDGEEESNQSLHLPLRRHTPLTPKPSQLCHGISGKNVMRSLSILESQ